MPTLPWCLASVVCCIHELQLPRSQQEHGVLRIVMPCKEGSKPQDIPVDSSDDEYVAVDEGDNGGNGGPSTA